ncbi:MAG TPA: hypothetical protein VF146_04230, partial [Bryobacteraceae bacterium]
MKSSMPYGSSGSQTVAFMISAGVPFSIEAIIIHFYVTVCGRHIDLSGSENSQGSDNDWVDATCGRHPGLSQFADARFFFRCPTN